MEEAASPAPSHLLLFPRRARAGWELGGGVRAAAARPGGSRGRGRERRSPGRARRASVARQPLPALRRPHRLPSPTRRRLGPGTREGTVRSHPRPAGAPRSRDLTVASRNRGGRGPERSRMSAHRCRPR
jgi:hypothetical protein